MMNSAAFDQRYVTEGDPWRYRSSDYERAKYAETLAACGPGRFRSAVELGASIGVFSALLAPRCEQLTTVDFSPVAVSAARRELGSFSHVEALVGEIPWGLDDRSRDLIVASEILYYLEAPALVQTLSWLERCLAPGGRLVLVHWRLDGPERPFSARQVHDCVRSLSWLAQVQDGSSADYLLHVLERP